MDTSPKRDRPTLLDAFCGAGGCSAGYHRAGFDVVGVDINPQPSYPFKFFRGDALKFISRYGDDFAMIHASPPCQVYSVTAHLSSGLHPALVEETREALEETRRLWVIENVPGAPLRDYVMLCGTMFGLGVIRHRLFECNPMIVLSPASCQHDGKATGGRERRRGNTKTPTLADGYKYVTVAGNNYRADEGRAAMGIDWMSKKFLSQAIPPAYTEWIGHQMMRWLP